MEMLEKHEKFEIEVLDLLNSKRLFDPLVFCGGTMLRLCHKLDRFSVDLDFWFVKEINQKEYFFNVKECLDKSYIINDFADKYHTMLFEIKSPDYPRSLKIEIRKEIKKLVTDDMIAYSKYSNNQVIVKTIRLNDLLESKIKTLLNRDEIRDCFDLEFLIKKNIEIKATKKELSGILKKIDSYKDIDYKVKLGSIINPELRKYYRSNNFKILKAAIEKKLKEKVTD